MKRLYIRLLPVFLIFQLFVLSADAAQMLIPVGEVVGLELHNNTVTVAAFEESSQAEASGLQVGDRIVTIDGQAVSSTEDIRSLLNRSKGFVNIGIERSGIRHQLRVIPEITGEGPKLGVYLRQGITGIGTVTFYNPETGTFGTLGHGVNDSAARLLTMTTGNAYRARISRIRKGTAGNPGQLIGALNDRVPIGTLYKNCSQGVFGKTARPWRGTALPVGSAETVRTGSAAILSTIDSASPKEYSVEILKVYSRSRAEGRNLLLRVTDPELLEATGGIVQGMSGSPIIQDGKLVGAVTHVLVNDPTTGYGIFIENMLDAAA